MSVSRLRILSAVVGLCWTWMAATVVAAGEGQPLGRELFEREWKQNDALSGRGDGLGPMFNAKSCVACHNQGGSGGGGAAEHNVHLLTVTELGAVDASGAPPSRTVLEWLHPGFRTANSVTIHTHGSGSDYTRYRARVTVHALRLEQ